MYSLYYNNNVEHICIGECYTLEEAKEICKRETQGYIEVGEKDNDYENRSRNFCVEVYEGRSCIIFKDGGVADFKEPIFQTPRYYID